VEFLIILEALLRRQNREDVPPIEVDRVESYPIDQAPPLKTYEPPTYTPLTQDDDYQALLAACESTHIKKHVHNMQHFGCGQETRWTADEDASEIVLAFADGFEVRATYEVFAHFDEKSKVFSIANPTSNASDTEAGIADALRTYGQRHNVAELIRPIADINLPDLKRVAYLAYDAKPIQGVFQRVYEAPKRDFVALTDFRLFNDNGDRISDDAFWQTKEESSPTSAESIAIVQAYFRDLNEAEQAWADDNQRLEPEQAKRLSLDPYLAKKKVSYEAYWAPAIPDYWAPVSMGRNDFDPADILEWFTVPRRGGGTYVIPLHKNENARKAYLVEYAGGEPKITNEDVEAGFHMNWIR
jgi:hypothetical protein